MTFDWLEFLDLAKYLAGKKDGKLAEEAARRTAISRIYYAAFGKSREYAVQHHHFSPEYSSQDHRRLREHFKSLGGGRWFTLAAGLDRLRK